MQSKSATYNTILAAENHFFEVKLNINGTDYGQDVIYGAKSDCKVFDTAPTIGGTYSGTLEFSLLGDGSAIPKMASVKPYFRAVLGATTSEWIQKGEFFIDTRSVSHNDNGLTVFSAHCFDAMLKANANYATSSLAWPATDTAVVAEIASKMGVSQDSRNSAILTGGYSIPLPTEYTMRDVLSFIAAMYAANWIITDEGKLRIVPIAGGADTLAVGKSCANLDISTSRSAYTKVIYEIDDETVVQSGSTDTNVMEVYNPFGTQTEADAVYAILSAWSYKPFDASGVWSDPCVEVGDQITAVGESGTIYSRSITFGPGMVMELSAPNDNYVDHEYEYESPEDRRYTRTVNGLSSSISLNASGVQIVSQKLDNFGGRNILLNSAKAQWEAFNGATVNFTTGVSVAAWGCNDAITATGTCGSKNVMLQLYKTSQTSNIYLADTTYTMSCYIKNNHATNWIRFLANGGSDYVQINPGETKRVSTRVDGDGSTALRMMISANIGAAFDFTYWHPQVECGEVLTSWNPAPEDKVGNDEIISKINVSTEGIVIQAAKVDLAGYVTFTNLSTSGQTTINGANITTGLIKDAANKNSWNLTTGALTITDGSINITTNSQNDDKILLTYGNYQSSVKAGGFEFAYKNNGIFTTRSTMSLSGVNYYDYAGNEIARLSCNGPTTSGTASGSISCYKHNANFFAGFTAHGAGVGEDSNNGVCSTHIADNGIYVNVGNGSGFSQVIDLQAMPTYGYNYFNLKNANANSAVYMEANSGGGIISVRDSNAVERAQLTLGYLTFKNSSGTITATYPATGIKKSLTSGDDLNTLTGSKDNGEYLIESGVTNAPLSWGGLLNISSGSAHQLAYNRDAMYVRSYTGSPLAWKNWKRIDETFASDIKSKNLLKLSQFTIFENYGVKITPQSNGTFKITGVCTTSFNITLGTASLKAGEQYYLSGATGGSSTTAFLNIQSVVNDRGSGSGAFTVSSSADYGIRVFIEAGATNLNLTFSPMVREYPSASSSFTKWVPTQPDTRIGDLRDCSVIWRSGAGGADTFKLPGNGMYLVCIGRLNRNEVTACGVYLVTAYIDSSRYSVLPLGVGSAEAPTITFDNNNEGLMTITTVAYYQNIAVYRLSVV